MRHRAVATLGLCMLAVEFTGCMTSFTPFQLEYIRGSTIVFTTTGDVGTACERVLARRDERNTLFAAAIRWPRAWRRRAFENPDVRVTRDGTTTADRTVPVNEQKRRRLLDESGFPMVAYRFIGSAPR